MVVGVWVRRHHREAVRFYRQQVVGQDAVHHLAIPELQPHPKSVHFGPSAECLALRGGVRRLEILHELNGFHLIVRHHRVVAVWGQQFHPGGPQIGQRIDKPEQRFPLEAADPNFF